MFMMANASLAAEETPQAATIRLPGIYHVWEKDTLQFNADSSALAEKAQQLKAKQQQFNGSLENLRNQLDQINAKTSAFNEQKKTFNNTLAAYKDKCTGAHKLEK